MRLSIQRDIDNGNKANAVLAELSMLLDENRGKIMEIDFNNVKFIAANQFAVLGAMFQDYCSDGNSQIRLSGLNEKLKSVMQKNGFGEHLGLEKRIDIFHTAIPHKQFWSDQSLEFEKYLLMNIFQRGDIPIMSEEAKNTIIDNFLEIFNNVKEHAATNSIHACGQFFPKSKMLYFTIADVGKTIKENVEEYFEKIPFGMEEKYFIEWALKEGNTTRMANSPGGLGLSMISRFIELNKGRLLVISDNEVFEYSKNRSIFMKNDYSFKGTIVTVGINMKDTFLYLAVDSRIEQIMF